MKYTILSLLFIAAAANSTQQNDILNTIARNTSPILLTKQEALDLLNIFKNARDNNCIKKENGNTILCIPLKEWGEFITKEYTLNIEMPKNIDASNLEDTIKSLSLNKDNNQTFTAQKINTTHSTTHLTNMIIVGSIMAAPMCAYGLYNLYQCSK